MRLFLLFLAIVLGVAFYSFAPRPLFKPDWRTPYEAAIKAGDCEQIERIVDLLFIAEWEGEAFEQVTRNYKEKRCKFSELPDETIEIADVLRNQGNIVDRNTPFNQYTTNSRFHKVMFERKRDKYPTTPFVKKLEKKFFHDSWNLCHDSVPRLFLGNPNFELLEYALNNPEVSLDQIAGIARSERRACAYQMVAQANIIANASVTPEDFASVVIFLWTPMLLTAENPELEKQIEYIEAKIPEEAYEISLRLRSKEGRYTIFTCEKDSGNRELEAAIHCASSAKESIGDVAQADLYALYYARRARRLGWQDVAAIEDSVSASISAECLETVIAHEAKEAEGVTDPRFIEKLKWPIAFEESCAKAPEEDSTNRTP